MRSELSYQPSGFFIQSLRIRATEIGVDGAIPVARVREIARRQTGHVRIPNLVQRTFIIDIVAEQDHRLRAGCTVVHYSKVRADVIHPVIHAIHTRELHCRGAVRLRQRRHDHECNYNP